MAMLLRRVLERLVERVRSTWEWVTRRAGGPSGYRDLRSLALSLDPSTIRMPEGERWSGAAVAAMEIGLPDGTTTIVSIADGTVSMYLSRGRSVIGAGDHAAVRGAAERFRTVLAEHRDLLQRTGVFMPPAVGEVRFHARIGDDRLTGVVSEALLRSRRHGLTPVYAAAQDVLTEIRLANEPDEVGASG